MSSITPYDDLEREHITGTLWWLESTDDIFRRAKPATPPCHLVSYVVLMTDDGSTLLVDHVNAGLFLPPGGHVEVDEHPLVAARRVCREELGIEASFADDTAPHFVTVTTTVGRDMGHVDVSLWFLGEGSRAMKLITDQTEFRTAGWWSLTEVVAAPGTGFDPHFQRFMQKVLSPKEG